MRVPLSNSPSSVHLPAQDRARYYCAALSTVNFRRRMNLLYLRRQSASEPMNNSFFEIRRWLSLCFLIAAIFVCASAQAPAPKASPTPRAPRTPRAPKPPDVYVRAEKAPVDSTVADDPAVNQM